MDQFNTPQGEPQEPASGQAQAAPGRWAWLSKILGPAIAIALIVIAVVVLREVTQEITWQDLRGAMRAVPLGALIASMLLAMAAMGTMGLYDVLSCYVAKLRHVPVRLSLVAGYCGYALSNALGFHVILGGTVRYRIYARAGLSGEQIAQILALSLATIWLSVAAMAAFVMVVSPLAVPLLRWAPVLTQATGAALGAVLLGLYIWLWRGEREIRLLGWRFPLPGGKAAIFQTLLGVVDFGLAAAALYVLIPEDLRPDFPVFMLIFTTSFLAGVVSHSPGGLGVLEAGILLGLGAANRPDAIAALMLFRLSYYVLPFVIAVLTLLGMELLGRSGRAWRIFLRYAAITGVVGLSTILLIVLTRK